MNKFVVEPWNEGYFLHLETGVVITVLASAYETSTPRARKPKEVDSYMVTFPML